jgi:hypothetical protein
MEERYMTGERVRSAVERPRAGAGLPRVVSGPGAAIALAALVTVLAVPGSVRAIPPGGDDPGKSCLDNVTASFQASPPSIDSGKTTTLTWSLQGTNCAGMTQSITGLGNVPRSGSQVYTLFNNRTWILTARLGSRSKSWTTSAAVSLPKDAYGRINVTITSNDQLVLFIQAISSPESTNAIVHINDDVSLDLSNWQRIYIAPGVQIIGGRSPTNPGPLLFTTTYPKPLFEIDRSDNVRITGIRLQGADGSVADEDSPDAIGVWINSSLNVEIDNNEVFGWHVSGISVHDENDRIDRRNGKGAVRIHDNYVHNNQRIGEGYGVEVSDGAYALVEKNTFCENRHSIAADGSYGDGYFFYRNVVCTLGGHHEVLGGIDTQTHQIDMHGQDDCWGADGYCGVAGEYMDIRYNSILYTLGTAIKLRGTPTQRMDVAYNTFRHSDVWGHWIFQYGAMEQTDGEDGIHQWGNTFGYPGTTHAFDVCDFDGDGITDTFVATGQTWTFQSGAAADNGHRYLNQSPLQADELDFGDFDGDGICDIRVRADGRVSLGGRTPLRRLARTDLLLANTASGQLRLSRLAGGVFSNDTYYSVTPDREVVGTGDFDGDGDTDILLRRNDVVPWPEGGGSGRRTTLLAVQDGAAVGQSNWGFTSAGGGVAGIADFDGDGASDVLWRDENGRLKLWYWGVSANVDVSWQNLGSVVVPPDWDVKAVGDFNGDGYADIVWRHVSGQVVIWLMVGSTYTGEAWVYGGLDPVEWTIQGVGDFDGDGRADLLWRHEDGGLAIWFKGSNVGAAYPSWRNQGQPMDPAWQVAGISDFDGDGRADILWRHAGGLGSIWTMNGATFVAESSFFLDTTWQIRAVLPVS